MNNSVYFRYPAASFSPHYSLFEQTLSTPGSYERLAIGFRDRFVIHDVLFKPVLPVIEIIIVLHGAGHDRDCRDKRASFPVRSCPT